MQCHREWGDSYSVYTDAALQYNERLARNKKSGDKPAAPFLTCKIEDNCITFPISLDGVEGTSGEMLGFITIVYAQYDQLEKLAKEAVQDGDTPAFEAISRRAVNKSHFLNGIKWAALALGIDESEFQTAINADADGR